MYLKTDRMSSANRQQDGQIDVQISIQTGFQPRARIPINYIDTSLSIRRLYPLSCKYNYRVCETVTAMRLAVQITCVNCLSVWVLFIFWQLTKSHLKACMLTTFRVAARRNVNQAQRAKWMAGRRGAWQAGGEGKSSDFHQGHSSAWSWKNRLATSQSDVHRIAQSDFPFDRSLFLFCCKVFGSRLWTLFCHYLSEIIFTISQL